MLLEHQPQSVAEIKDVPQGHCTWVDMGVARTDTGIALGHHICTHILLSKSDVPTFLIKSFSNFSHFSMDKIFHPSQV